MNSTNYVPDIFYWSSYNTIGQKVQKGKHDKTEDKIEFIGDVENYSGKEGKTITSS